MGKFVYYHYTPSIPAAAVAIALFSFSAALHLYQMIRTRTWFMIPFVIGCFLEVVGYAGRIVSSNEGPDYTLGPFIVQNTTLLVAPALFAASIYMELGRISMLVNGDSYLLIRRRWMTSLFVTGDVLSFLTQGAGGGLMATASNSKIGSDIVVAGLFIQVIFFGGFVVVALLFHRKLHKMPTNKVLAENPPYRRHLFTLYGTSILIFFRSVVRIVEFIQGFSGFIISHEIFLYLCDGLPMVVAVLMMNWVHPSEVQSLLRGGRMVKNGYQMMEFPSPGRKAIV